METRQADLLVFDAAARVAAAVDLPTAPGELVLALRVGADRLDQRQSTYQG